MITLLDVRNQIIGVFCEKSTFELVDKDSINLTKDLNDRRNEIVDAALYQLHETGLIQKVSKDFWMLNHPIGSSGQEVKLSMVTCNNVAETINTFLKAQDDDETPRADSLNLNEGHIITLLQILDTILMEGQDAEEEDENQENNDLTGGIS